MGARGEAFAKQFEAKALEATTVFEGLSDADWKKVTSAEKWPVGVTAHHIAMAHPPISGFVKNLADGKPGPNVQMETLHAMNAQHAKDFASVGKAETIALHKKNVAAAAALLRGISDADFDRTGNVLAGAPPMSAAQLVTQVLVGHIDEHLGSIRAMVGR
jgi:hypothetical protein